MHYRFVCRNQYFHQVRWDWVQLPHDPDGIDNGWMNAYDFYSYICT